MIMFSAPSDLMRIDPLTGCKNFLGFLESCMEPVAEGSEDRFPSLRISPDYLINALSYSAVLFVSMHNMRLLNKTKGFAHGDSAIRWMGILLQEETNQTVYRFTGTEFAVLLKMDNEQEHFQMLERIIERMNREAEQLEFPGSPADIALILNDQSSTCLDSLLMQMGEAMVRVKNNDHIRYMIFHATDFQIPAWTPYTWTPADHADVSFAVRWMIRASIYQVMDMGKNLDIARQDAYTDPISNLPNMRAAFANVEEIFRLSQPTRRPFSILLIDGDNFRAYNNTINYAAGDEAICKMSAVLKQNLRPNDCVARWRNGDEFLVILPDTTGEDAKKIGERFRMAVKTASLDWRIPLTISTGIASFPENGEDLKLLIDKAEAANKRAKQQGKDLVILAD